MKIPERPPLTENVLSELLDSGNTEKIALLLSSDIGVTDEKGRYLHWEKLKYLPPPEGLNSVEYWFATKMARQKIMKDLPFKDKNGNAFVFCVPSILNRSLHWLDKNAAGRISMNQPITNPHTRDTYLVSSLIEESISSSQLEGASTTRNVAKQMLKQGREPTDHSERMIFNNYRVMQIISEYKDDDLTPSLILHIHKVITEGTLEEDSKAGQLRGEDDDIHVVDATESSVLHTPPGFEELGERLNRICAFANSTSENSNEFIHPVVRAIILHFMIGYDHPFIDGNGRTARAIFYWAMAKHGFWLMEFVSISTVIKKAPVKYGKAYFHSETDGNDLTYFLNHQINVVIEAVESLHEYLFRKGSEIEEAERLLESSQAEGKLNHRQLFLLKHALKNPNAMYEINEHRISHKISYQTARTDLLKMSDDLKLLTKRKYGKSFVFIAPLNLRERLSD